MLSVVHVLALDFSRHADVDACDNQRIGHPAPLTRRMSLERSSPAKVKLSLTMEDLSAEASRRSAGIHVKNCKNTLKSLSHWIFSALLVDRLATLSFSRPNQDQMSPHRIGPACRSRPARAPRRMT